MRHLLPICMLGQKKKRTRLLHRGHDHVHQFTSLALTSTFIILVLAYFSTTVSTSTIVFSTIKSSSIKANLDRTLQQDL